MKIKTKMQGGRVEVPSNPDDPIPPGRGCG